MKEIYKKYKNELKNKNNLTVLVLIVFIIGLIFGSIYITILSQNQKGESLSQITSYYKNLPKLNFEDKIDIFKNSLYSNLLYMIIIWALGISIIGVPIIFIMIFFKSFLTGFSISNIFAKYGISGIIKVLLYLLPSNIIIITYIIFLSTYSIFISSKIFKSAFKKQTINFKSFMGKYLFVLIIGILISILCSLYEAFINPFFYKVIY